MKKSFSLTLLTLLLTIGSYSQIVFDTSYHENLNLDINLFSYDHSFYLINNSIDPGDTLFQWEVTHVENTENHADWAWYVLTNFMEIAEPRGKYNSTILLDTPFLFRLGFWIDFTPGCNLARLKVSSVLHPEITDSITINLQARDLMSTGVSELNRIEVYPNPASDLVKIRCTPGSVYHLTNSLGQKVRHGKLENWINFIQIGDIPGGLYTLHVSGQEEFTKKLLVQ